MSLFSRGRQHSLYSFRLAALLAHLLDLLSEVLLLHLRQLVSVEVPGHVDAEVACRDSLQLNQLFNRYLRETCDPGREIYDSSRALHEID